MSEPTRGRTLSRLDRSDETPFDLLRVNDIVEVVLNKKESGIDHLIGKIYRIEGLDGRNQNHVVHILLRDLPQSLTPMVGLPKLSYLYFNYKNRDNEDVDTENEYGVFEGCISRNQIFNRHDLFATKLIKIGEEGEDRPGQVSEATEVGPLDLNGDMHQIEKLGSVVTQPIKLEVGRMYYVKLSDIRVDLDQLTKYLTGKGYIAECKSGADGRNILTPLYYRCEKTCNIGPWMKFSNNISEELTNKSQRWRTRNLLILPIISRDGDDDIFNEQKVFIVELNNDIKVSENVSPDEATELLKEMINATRLTLNSRKLPLTEYGVRRKIESYLLPDKGDKGDKGGNKKRNKTHKKQKKLRRKNTRNK